MHLDKPANFVYVVLSIYDLFLPPDSLLHCQLNTKLQKSLPNAMSPNHPITFQSKRNYVVSMTLHISVQGGTRADSSSV